MLPKISGVNLNINKKMGHQKIKANAKFAPKSVPGFQPSIDQGVIQVIPKTLEERATNRRN